ncbi:MAG TPA: metalloregulator ArsR/SmtB family transcription factor [Rhizomicrobium sp.]|jgi:DNA-binding transcriptional ArsR family regulator
MTQPMHRHPALPIFKIFGVPSRLVVFQRVARRPSTAGELARELPISRTAVVQHLTLLRRHGLVEQAADGRRRVYRATAQGLAPLRDWLARHDKPRA